MTPTPMEGVKIVPFGRTKPCIARRMLELAGTTRDDVVLDLGSGDGSIILEAAKTFRARSIGVEIDKELAGISLSRARWLGVERMVEVRVGDFTRIDLPKASVVTLYLLPSANKIIANRLLTALPDSRVVAHKFPIPGWRPVEVEEYKGVNLYLYVPRVSSVNKRPSPSPRETE